MIFCLPPQYVDKMKSAIRSGKLNPAKMNAMTSIQRRKFLSTIVGKGNAKEVNLLFERKLLLKNQEKAMTDWARETTGMSKEAKEKTLEKIRQTYAEKKRRLENPKENEKFLNEITSDVYSKKMKTDITLDEAQKITELSADVAKYRENMNADFTFKTKQDKINYGASKVAFENYTSALKSDALKRPLLLPTSPAKIIEDFRIAANFIADNSRALLATFDNSFWGRQGIKVLFSGRFTHLWAKNFAKSFKDIAQIMKSGTKKGDVIIDATKAEIYSRKNYLNGRYELGKKLDVKGVEEEFPTSLPSKIPVLGRFFKAAETAYEAGAMRLRADVADAMYKMVEKTGRDMKNKVTVGDINQMINSMTGRGGLPIGESYQAAANKTFFSIKFLKANLDTLMSPILLATNPRSFARQQAAKNLLMITSVVGSILGIAKALDPDSVNFDPRSTNFGKIKIGNTKFDITGGMGSILTLLSRIIPTKKDGEWGQYSESSVTGKVTKLGEGYGAPDGMDVFWQFVQNKFSPLASVISQTLKRETFEGDKPSILSTAKGLTVPIIMQEGAEASQNERSANLMLILIAEALGISANTYGLRTSWQQSTSKELIEFKEKVGDKTFKKANDEYNKKVNDWFDGVVNTDEYKNKDDEEKANFLSKERRKIKEKVFRDYKFYNYN